MKGNKSVIVYRLEWNNLPQTTQCSPILNPPLNYVRGLCSCQVCFHCPSTQGQRPPAPPILLSLYPGTKVPSTTNFTVRLPRDKGHQCHPNRGSLAPPYLTSTVPSSPTFPVSLDWKGHPPDPTHLYSPPRLPRSACVSIPRHPGFRPSPNSFRVPHYISLLCRPWPYSRVWVPEEWLSV